ncbi:MAG TPA: hypothetical protein VFG66_06375 [Gemmatimonadales bacterium]|nr:hypothetical protein [Gemmatimonadales bacterium]
MRRPPAAVDDRGRALRREVLELVALVLLVDGVFIGLYYLLGLAATRDGLKPAYTILWTAVTLLVVLRGLGRIRAARLRLRR